MSRTTVLDASVGFNPKDYVRSPFSQGFLPSTLGLPQSMDAIAAQNSLEFPNINTGSGTLGQATFTTLDIESYAYSSRAEITKMLSKHTFKGGFEFGKYLMNFYQYGNPSGQFGFGTGPTVRVENVTQPTTEGFADASFLLGLPNNGGGISHSFSIATASPYIGTFFQDEYKATRKLTLNIGLRGDADIPRTERYNRLSWFDLNAPSPISGKVAGFGELKGALMYASPDQRRQVATDANNWGPRLGFAYSITDKTVFRGAYGVTYSASPYTAAGTSGSSGTIGFQTSTPVNVTPDNYRTITARLSNPFPTGYNLPLGSAAGPGFNLGNRIGEVS